MTEPKWLQLARQDLGVAEIAGPTNNPRIMQYYKAANANWAKAETVPWCGAAMAAWVAGAGGLCGFATFSAHGGLPSVSPHGLECTSTISCGQLIDRCACVNGRTLGPVRASR